MNPIPTQLVLGLSGAGKTTFIAALRHVTEAGDVPDALRLQTLGDDDMFVNMIKGRWLKCEPLEHTSADKERLVRLRLCRADVGQNAVDLDFPDLAGELIEQQWSLRRCKESYAELARSASGVLLFVHPETIITATCIADANVAMSALVGERNDPPSEASMERPYNPRDSATQLKLVELLQFLIQLRDSGPPIPLAVVISAWDRVRKTSVGLTTSSPKNWLQESLPLFDQYLRANKSNFCFRVFGLSAQGGDLQEDLAALQSLSPSKRILLLNGQSESNNITLPIQWLAETAGLMT